MSMSQRSIRIILPGLVAFPACFSSLVVMANHAIFSHVFNPWVAGVIYGAIIGLEILVFFIAFKKRVLSVTNEGLAINKRMYSASEIQSLKYLPKSKFIDLKPTKGFLVRMQLRCDDRERTDVLNTLKEWAGQNAVHNEGF